MRTILAAAAALLAMTVAAHAEVVSIGSFIISAFLSAGIGGALPVISAAAIGGFRIGRRSR